MPVALLALAIGGFGIGLTEFVIMGLLPEVSTDFGVSETTAGYLISGYALSVAIGAVGLTLLLTRVPRKVALLGLMVLFILGNLISAVSPDYATMMVGRIVAALCHGAFFGIGSVVAAQLVAPDRKASAIAFMFGGLTLANVLGVPLGTLLGQAAGWRSTFWAITVIGIIAFIGIALLVPVHTGRSEAAAPAVRTELAAFASPQVWFSIALTVLGYGGMFGGFTYIAFTLTEVSGFSAGAVPLLLVLFGVGLFFGNIVGGRAADRDLVKTLGVLLTALTIVLAAFALVATSQVLTVVALVLMGAVGFGTVPALQMRVMGYADEAPTLASGANIAAFNVGNALGAWIGGLTLAAGLGYTSPLWAGAGVTAVGLLVLLAAVRAPGGERRTSVPVLPETSPHPREGSLMTIPTITLNNGVAMPQLGYGVFQVPDDETEAAVTAALEAGYRSIDTAAVYGNEAGVGRALAKSGIAREELFVTTKLWNFDHERPVEAYEKSLELLGLDQVDLYLIHWPTPVRDLYVGAWQGLEELYAAERVRAIGVSNFLPEHLDRVVGLGGTVPAVNQIELHPALQQRATVAANDGLGIATEAWSPLAQGTMLENPAITPIADRLGRTPAQVILRWHLQQGRIVIPKSVTPSRIAQNLDVFEFDLTGADLVAIDALESEGRTGPDPATFNAA